MATKNPPEINAGSMADIAFLLLVFFLVTTTMESDFGLARRLPPTEIDLTQKPIKERNVLEVLVNANDQLLVEGEETPIHQLKDIAKEFIANPNNKIILPEKEEKDIPFIGNYMVSKQVVSLQNDNGTSYNMYIQIQNELAKAYNELRNELAVEQWGKSYDYYVELQDKDRIRAVRKVYPQRISEAEPRDVGGPEHE